MFRRDGDRLTVAVMWSAGTVTGWQHVFRSECASTGSPGRVVDELERLGFTSAASQGGPAARTKEKPGT